MQAGSFRVNLINAGCGLLLHTPFLLEVAAFTFVHAPHRPHSSYFCFCLDHKLGVDRWQLLGTSCGFYWIPV